MTKRFLMSILGASFIFVPGVLQAQLILAVDSSRALYELDPTTGAKTLRTTLGSTIGTPGALAYDPNTDTLYASSSSLDSLWKVDYNTGAVTLVGAYNVGTSVVMHGLEWHMPTQSLFAIDSASNNLYSVDKTTGQAAVVGLTAGTGFSSMAWNTANSTMYMGDADTEVLYSLDLSTGASTPIGPFGVSGSLGTGMAYHPTLGVISIDNTTDALYTLNINTGAATLVGTYGSSNILGVAVVTPVPEPATLAAVGLGLAALIRRRRK